MNSTFAELRSKFDSVLVTLNHLVAGRSDIVMTTSFGYQSALLFHTMNQVDATVKCLYIKSSLSFGGVDEQAERICDRFSIDVDVVERDSWLDASLGGQDFTDLSEISRNHICKELKRQPLLDFISENDLAVWVTGVRKDQTVSRRSMNFIDVTDLGVLKISPLINFTAAEVDDLCTMFDLPLNRAYVDLCKLNDKRECGLHI